MKKRIGFPTKTLASVAVVGLIGYGFVAGQYGDGPGFSSKTEMGRTKNSIAAVVAGIVGQKMYGESEIDLEIEKTLFPNARVTGRTTRNSVDTYVDLATTSAHFTANNNPRLEGKVSKSEFDWKVKQISPNTYEIQRWGLKLDSALKIDVKDGKISGNYARELGFDWKVDGTYDQKGNVSCEVSVPWGLDIVLKGKVTEKK